MRREVQREVQPASADRIEVAVGVAVAGEMEGAAGFGLANLQALLVTHYLELGAKVLDLVQELQGQRGTRQVNAEIALQVHGDARAAHLYSRRSANAGVRFLRPRYPV